jgi:hypothetical protein
MKKQEKRYLIYGGLALLGVGGYFYYTKMAMPKYSNVDAITAELTPVIRNAKVYWGNDSEIIAALIKHPGKCTLVNYGPIVKKVEAEHSALLSEAKIDINLKNDNTKLKKYVELLVHNIQSISC